MDTFFARDLSESGRYFGEAYLVCRDFEVKACGLRGVVKKPETVDSDVVECNERDLAVR